MAHIAVTGALMDMCPMTVPTAGGDKAPDSKNVANGPRMLTDDGLYGNAYGWQIFGERWRSWGGHSKRGARQPMDEDDYLLRWYVTGNYAWLQAGDARSQQFRDVRNYRVEDTDPFAFADWKEFRTHYNSEDHWTQRPAASDDEARRYSQGRYPRATFWLPNPAHMVLDLVYDRYLLTGDQRAFENLPIIAAHGGYFVAYGKPAVHRNNAWCWRTLFRYWELTGDPRAERLLRLTIQNYRKFIDGPVVLPTKHIKDAQGKQKTVVIWWWMPLFGRATAMTALTLRDPDALAVCRKFAEVVQTRAETEPAGFSVADFSEVNGVLYHLTGDEKYKTRGWGKDNGEGLKRATIGMALPACGHWLLTQAPKPLK